jgi:hypothetical protein
MPAPTPATATADTGAEQSQSTGPIDEASSEDGPKGADAHRQSDEEEESAPPIPPEAGGGGDGGIGSGTQPPASGAGGTTIAGISVKTIAIAGGVAIAGYLAYRYFQGQQRGPQALGGGSTGQDANPEPEDAQEPEVSEQQARTNGHNEPIPNNPDDPLQADHEAGKQVFGWES